jgi:DNA damage-binding protein 1
VEIWAITPEGQLVMLHSKAIYGRVSMLQKIRPFGSNVDHLFVGTARFQYFTVVWNPETRQLDTVQSFVDLAEKHMQNSQSRDRCIIDPTGQILVMELFQGILNLVRIVKPKKGKPEYLGTPTQVRIAELKVKASTFLHTETDFPKLAILYDAGKSTPDLRLVTYRVLEAKGQYSDFNHSKDREDDLGDLDIGASHLIPVRKAEEEQKRYIVRNSATAKAQLGGVIIVGETKMTYLDDESKVVVESALDEANIWVAWERYNDLNYLLADDYARLYLLTIVVDGAIVTGMEVRMMGNTTKATAMVNLGNDFLFIASHEGDSQFIRLNITQELASLELLQTIPNIAPILDFTVMDLGGHDGEGTNEYSSGQARLVTGSGVWEGGSLRSVRSGVGLEDHGILADIDDIRGLFSLRSNNNVSRDDILLISLAVQTRVLKFDYDGQIEEVSQFQGLTLNAHTLLARNLPNDYLLQVTTSAVTLIKGSAVEQWNPEAGHVITAASANDETLMLSSNGVTLASFDLTQHLKVMAIQNLENDEQIACIHVPTLMPGIGVVGFWKSGSISILDTSNLEILHSEELRRTNDASIPRNIALTQILPDSLFGPTLFVAMEDGIVLTFNVDKANVSLSGRKSIVLGTQQAQFQILPGTDGLFNIFATCEHPSLIYGSEGRIICSAVTAESATHVCSFDSEAFPNSIIVATASDLKVSQIDTERRTHVKSLHIGETVRRIAYSESERAFGLGCLKRVLYDGDEILRSTFRLVEEVNFREIGEPFEFEPDLLGEEAIECIIRAQLWSAEDGGGMKERFLVGTTWETLDPKFPNQKGRIHVFGVDNNRSPYLIHSEDLLGACRCLAVMGEGRDTKIVAALVCT